MKATSIIPCFAYEDAEKAIDWLEKAFGFKKKAVYPTEDDKIAHAELVLGQCMIMIGSTNTGSDFSKMIRQPSETGGYVTQSPYIVLAPDEIDSHYETAMKNGARIAIPFEEKEYGGKNYSCYDLEGHLWNFGSYDPWKEV